MGMRCCQLLHWLACWSHRWGTMSQRNGKRQNRHVRVEECKEAG